jgi:hypothetical protein
MRWTLRGRADLPESGLVACQVRSPAEQHAYYLNDWRSWQMSDHLPMWVQLKVDFTDAYLKSLRPGHTPLADFSGNSDPTPGEVT